MPHSRCASLAELQQVWVAQVQSVYHSPIDNSSQTLSRIELVIPNKMPGTDSPPGEHVIYIILDTSGTIQPCYLLSGCSVIPPGSTSIGKDGMTFLARCQGFLTGLCPLCLAYAHVRGPVCSYLGGAATAPEHDAVAGSSEQ